MQYNWIDNQYQMHWWSCETESCTNNGAAECLDDDFRRIPKDAVVLCFASALFQWRRIIHLHSNGGSRLGKDINPFVFKSNRLLKYLGRLNRSKQRWSDHSGHDGIFYRQNVESAAGDETQLPTSPCEWSWEVIMIHDLPLLALSSYS